MLALSCLLARVAVGVDVRESERVGARARTAHGGGGGSHNRGIHTAAEEDAETAQRGASRDRLVEQLLEPCERLVWRYLACRRIVARMPVAPHPNAVGRRR